MSSTTGEALSSIVRLVISIKIFFAHLLISSAGLRLPAGGLNLKHMYLIPISLQDRGILTPDLRKLLFAIWRRT